jgi:hypothetical protein
VQLERNAAGRVVTLTSQILPVIGENDGQYTDRLLKVARDQAHTNRQCSIGYHLECSDPAGEECQCECHPWPQDVAEAPMEMGERMSPQEFVEGKWVPYPDTVEVPLAALKALVERADGWRTQADQEFVVGAVEQAASDKEFADLVAALGIEGLED